MNFDSTDRSMGNQDSMLELVQYMENASNIQKLLKKLQFSNSSSFQNHGILVGNHDVRNLSEVGSRFNPYQNELIKNLDEESIENSFMIKPVFSKSSHLFSIYQSPVELTSSVNESNLFSGLVNNQSAISFVLPSTLINQNFARIIPSNDHTFIDTASDPPQMKLIFEQPSQIISEQLSDLKSMPIKSEFVQKSCKNKKKQKTKQEIQRQKIRQNKINKIRKKKINDEKQYQDSKKQNQTYNVLRKLVSQIQQIEQSQKTKKKPEIDPQHQKYLNKMLTSLGKSPQKQRFNRIRYPTRVQLTDFRIIQSSQSCSCYCLTLEHLQIDFTQMTNHQWHKVRSINLRDCNITDEKLKIFMQNLYQFPDLQWIDLGLNQISQKGALYITKYLSRGVYLKELAFENNNLTQWGLRTLMHKKNEELKLLRNLNLGFNQIGDYGFYVLCKYLSNLPIIQNIVLAQNSLTNMSMQFLDEFINNFTHLKELNLLGNQINDNGIEYLTNQMHILSKLKRLNLDNNRIGSRGFALICQKLYSLQRFQMLYLKNNQICMVEQKNLDDLDNTKSLIKVELKNNPFSYNKVLLQRIMKRYIKNKPHYSIKIVQKNCPLNFSNESVDFPKVFDFTNTFFKQPMIRILNLSGCGLKDSDWIFFIQKTNSFLVLQHLILDHNQIQNITEADILQLEKSLKIRSKVAIKHLYIFLRNNPILTQKSLELIHNHNNCANLSNVQSSRKKQLLLFIVDQKSQENYQKSRRFDEKNQRKNLIRTIKEWILPKRGKKYIDSSYLSNLFYLLDMARKLIERSKNIKENVKEDISQAMKVVFGSDPIYFQIYTDTENANLEAPIRMYLRSLIEHLKQAIFNTIDLWDEEKKKGIELSPIEQQPIKQLKNLNEQILNQLISFSEKVHWFSKQEKKRKLQLRQFYASELFQIKNFPQSF